ncbi:protein FAM131A-like isoform X3 [Pseudoliparis swirei]|uniref:protein FAM131A-like isoform X3 n=1 Tax=Pseudoliparis swirei TaxID=2059687 RepID=UPI0024BE2B41|nr:protein FAM131A-like isoform X3 [Pseudoliparis swirei]
MVLTALTHFSCKVNVDDTVEMLPKSRRALTIQEIAALARSSLHGISQVVKDHVTKPTAMAQGRVARLIEWKGWSKPTDAPAAPQSDLNSYSDLTEGEQEARFAADVSSYPPYLKDLIHSQLCHHLGLIGPCCEGGGGRGGGGGGGGSGEPSPTSPDTLCSSLCSLDEHHPLLRGPPHPHRGGGSHSYGNAAELAAKILSALQGGEELLLARLQRAGRGGAASAAGDSGFHSLGGGGVGGRGIRPCGGQDSPCYSVSYSDTCLSPGDDDDDPCKDYESGVGPAEGGGPEYDPRRRVSDVASSGIVSLDEEEEEEEEEGRGQESQSTVFNPSELFGGVSLLFYFFCNPPPFSLNCRACPSPSL